uniref:tetratricopeptide repeat protein n=1 Tax=Nocardia testacea TaxID=248551 RepID=UPI0005855294
DHPSTLVARSNLAGAYSSAGRTTEAIPLYEQALTGFERILSGDGPDTARFRFRDHLEQLRTLLSRKT